MHQDIIITSEHGVGDLNALIGDRVVAVAFVRENEWRIYDIVNGGGPIAEGLTGYEVPLALFRVAKGLRSDLLQGNGSTNSKEMD